MLVVTIDEKKGLAPTPIIWLKTTMTETGYYWPLYGLLFKLKNYSPLPVDSKKLKKEWRYVPCKILLNGKKFKTCKDAEKAISEILKNGKGENEIQLDEVQTEEVRTEEVKAKEAKEAKAKEAKAKEAKAKEAKAKEAKSKEAKAKEAKEAKSKEAKEVHAKEVQVKEVQVKEVQVKEVQTDEVDPEEVQTAEVQTDEVIFNEVDNHKLDMSKSDKVDDRLVNLPFDKVVHFKANEELLKNTNRLTELKEFYKEINENSERKFFDKIVNKTFENTFFLDKVTFKKDKKRENKEDSIGLFNNTRLYDCLKKAVIEKLKLTDLDDTDLKKIFMDNFERIKRAIKARN